MKRWKYTIFSFAILMSVSFPAEAVYPVRDSENILQQAKNYAESIKIVTEATKTALDTANLVKNSILQVTKLPQEIIQQQVANLNNSLASVKGIIRDVTNPTKMAREIWPEIDQGKEMIDSIKKMGNGHIPIEINIAVIETAQAQDDMVLNAQKKASESYEKLSKDTQEAQEELNKLVEKSKTATGENQLAQIGIAMKGFEARIRANAVQMGLLKAQTDQLRDQAMINKARAEEEGRQANARAQAEGLDAVVNALKDDNAEPYNRDFTIPADEKAPWK